MKRYSNELTRIGFRIGIGGVFEVSIGCVTPFGLRCGGALIENASNDWGCNDVEGVILIVDELLLLLRCAVEG